jgi:hypothetical protein
MRLPADFQFSQGSLQDYVDCPRRFQLRYLLRRAWPAVEAEPALEVERHVQQGAAFHRLVHQHVLGIAPEQLSDAVDAEDLRRWWHNYVERGPADLPASRHPEIVLSSPLSGHRLVAKYDLVAVDAGRRAVIVDWKTNRRRPRRDWLARRLQTRVYRYLLVRAGAYLNDGTPFQPEQVHMVYWFANFPADPAWFTYDAVQFDADEVYVASLIEEIREEAERRGSGDFPLTSQERHCRFCPYRSLCRREVERGGFEELGEESGLVDEALSELSWRSFDVSLDFEQVAEVEY